jgi:hypothetical protein
MDGQRVVREEAAVRSGLSLDDIDVLILARDLEVGEDGKVDLGELMRYLGGATPLPGDRDASA